VADYTRPTLGKYDERVIIRRYPAANEAEMLALPAQQGDWCDRTDTGTSFMLNSDNPSVLADWVEAGAGGGSGSGTAGGNLQVLGVKLRGTRTIPEINALTGLKDGTTVVAGSAGTPSASGSDTLAIGDIAEYHNPSVINPGWRIIVAHSGGYPPANTRLLIDDGGKTIYSPFTNNTDNAKVATYDGTSLTPNLATKPFGATAVNVNTHAQALWPAREYLMVGVPGVSGYWDLHNLGYYTTGDGVQRNSTTGQLEVNEGLGLQHVAGQLRAKVDASLNLTATGIRVTNLLNPVVAVADASGGATAAALTVDAEDINGVAYAAALVMLLVASNTQYAGLLDPNANVTLDTQSKGSILASDASAGWWLIKTDSNGQFAYNANNSSDEQVWFSVEQPSGGVDALASGALIRGCVPDSATWS
jgi:hypothetical protein